MDKVKQKPKPVCQAAAAPNANSGVPRQGNFGYSGPKQGGVTNHKGKQQRPVGQKHAVKNVLQKVEVDHTTRVYLRGRDLIYPDAASLTRFNTWVTAHQGEIDPAEQFVCKVCGHVDLILCQHSIAQDPVQEQEEEPEIVPDRLRTFTWAFRPFNYFISGFQWPAFDTHSCSDSRLHGFSNELIPDDLVVVQLFNYLVNNMQTSYSVNGVESRALRLAHVHKLAQKWVIKSGFERRIEDDQHFSVRVRFTIQRATDNMQNNMLYEERTPARNFGLAWLPKSRVSQVLAVVFAVLLILYWQTAFGLVLRGLQVIVLFVKLGISALNCLAVTVPDLGMKVFVSATAPQSGSTHGFQCASGEYYTTWNVLEEDVHSVIQSCSFTDWVMAGVTEATLRTSATFGRASESIAGYKGEICNQLALELASYQLVWASRQFSVQLEAGQITPYQVLQLWAWTTWSQLRILLYHC